SCFARRAASVSNDRAILSNFFLTRGSVAWLAKLRHFSAIFRYSKPLRIIAPFGYSKTPPRSCALLRAPWRGSGGSVRGGDSPQFFPHPEPWQLPDAPLAEQARNRDHHSGDPPSQAYKQQKVAQEKRHTRLPATSPYRATLPFHHVALRSMPNS